MRFSLPTTYNSGSFSALQCDFQLVPAVELSPALCGRQALVCTVQGAELELKGVDEGFAYVGNVVF